MDAKSPVFVVFFCFLLFLLASKLLMFDVLFFNGAALLIWVLLWSDFFIGCVIVL